MWGCLLASAVTFPRVFGWIQFASVPGDLPSYRAYAFGFPTASFRMSLTGLVLSLSRRSRTA